MAVELKEPEVKKARDQRAIRKVLTDLRNRHPEKLLVAEEVVENAKDESSPLHAFFEWSDTAAAHQYRIAQARALIKKIVVSMPDDKSESMLPKYVSLRSDRKKPSGGYRETNEVLNNPQFLAELEETAKADLDGVLQRYQMLTDLCERVRKAAGIKARADAKKAKSKSR